VFVRFFLVPLPKPQPAATPTFAFVTHPAGSPNVVVL